MTIKIYTQDLRNFINNNGMKILAGGQLYIPTQLKFVDLNINLPEILLSNINIIYMTKTKDLNIA
jgi:hypothetical protein